MSGYGLEIRNKAGRLWVSPSVRQFALCEKINSTFTTDNTVIQTKIGSSDPIIIFVKTDGVSPHYAIQIVHINQNGFHAYRVRLPAGAIATIKMFVFSNRPMKRYSDYGLDIFDASGTLTYTVGAAPLEIMRKTDTEIGGREPDITFDIDVAICPIATGIYSVVGNSAGGMDVFQRWVNVYGRRVTWGDWLLATGTSVVANVFARYNLLYIPIDKYERFNP